MKSAYDMVIVGSGFGGGVTACRMAERGLRVCVLERGRRFGPGDFPDRPEQAPLAFWHPLLNPGGMLDLRLMRDLSVITGVGVGVGVGGGSLVYANVQLRAPASVFDEAPWPAAITRAELDPYYDRTEEALEPRETPAMPDLPKIRAFDEMAAALVARRPGSRSPCTSARVAAIRSAASSSRAARTSAVAISGVRYWPRTRSTSPTSRALKPMKPRYTRCTRCSGSTRPAAPAAAGRWASAICSTGSPGRSRRRCSSWPPGRSGAAGSFSRTAGGCVAYPARSEAASRATATRWPSR